MKFRFKLSRQHVLAGLLLVSVVTSFMGRGASEPLRGFARLAFEATGDGGMYLATAAAERLSKAKSPPISQTRARRLARENEILNRQVRFLVRQRRRLENQIKQIQSIRSRLYGPTREMPSELIHARVVGRDSLPYSSTQIVNIGSSDGGKCGNRVTTRELLIQRSGALPPNRAVITESSLVGILTETDEFTARMQLITDRRFSIAVLVRRVVDPRRPRRITVMTDSGLSEEILTAVHDDVEAKARGDGTDGMTISHVKAYHNVRAGDGVSTRHSDGLVGAEIPIGTVTRVEQDSKKPGLFVTLYVKPHADLAALRDVYIIEPPALSPPRREGKRR